MALTRFKLGSLIEKIERKNYDLKFTVDDVCGVSAQKTLMPTKADINGRNISVFSILQPNEFVYNRRTTRMGDRICIAYNDTKQSYILTEDYILFFVKNEDALLPQYLYMFFNRPEFDRYARTNSWGSATELFSWEEMCDVDIEVPPLPIQQKYVDIYKAMVANQQSYARGLDDLKLSFDAFLDKVKHASQNKAVGELLKEVDCRNAGGKITDVQGININKQFMPSVADIFGVNLENYKVVRKGQFAYSGMQTGRDECIRIALYTGDPPIIISPAYSVFEVKDETVLADYIMVWFSRAESDRRGWFMSDSSIRTNLDLDRFYEIQIPVPNDGMQRSIVELYSVYIARRRISEQLKAQIKDICPILIKGSLEEARNE